MVGNITVKFSAFFRGYDFTGGRMAHFLPRCMECRRGLAMRMLSVRGPSVCPSVTRTRVNCDKTVERSVQIYIKYERSFSVVF